MVEGYKKALTSLWIGKCDIYVLKHVQNPKNGRSEAREEKLHEQVPCRISYKDIATTDLQDGAKIVQSTKLILDAGVKIPPGCKIVVTQNGVTETYTRSGLPAVYTNHQEVELTLFKEYA